MNIQNLVRMLTEIRDEVKEQYEKPEIYGHKYDDYNEGVIDGINQALGLIEKGGLSDIAQEQTYTVITPDGVTDYMFGLTMWEVYKEAVKQYGEGVVLRPSWYGEWDCGVEGTGACYYDKYGNHRFNDYSASSSTAITAHIEPVAQDAEGVNG